MKFLCVRCDEPMKLKKTDGPDAGGSLSVLFSCPKCLQETALLTNPYETQLVSSLGVKIGGKVPATNSPIERGGLEKGGLSEGEGDLSKCPFSDVVQKAMSGSVSDSESGFPWTEEAVNRLEKIPEFVRPMAKMGIEKFAKDSGYMQVDEKVLDQAKTKFGM